MNSLNNVFVEISVVLGRTTMPIHQLLKMGRGAVIELNVSPDDEIWLYANNVPIARGNIILHDERIAIEITSTAADT